MICLCPGCQDPWNFNPKVSLPVCDNITKILGSYSKGPDAQPHDGQYMDRPFMPERELATLERNGIKCPPPCQQIYYDTDITYTHKNE